MTHTPTKNSETGIDWEKHFPSNILNEWTISLLERAAQIALSRQSAVGGDWEKEDIPISVLDDSPMLDDLERYDNDLLRDPSGKYIKYSDLSWIIPRALQCATRTPEGDWRKEIDQIKADLLTDTESHGYGAFWHEAVHAVCDKITTPPPRPTATGGITEADVLKICGELLKQTISPDAKAAIHTFSGRVRTLIERAGEQEAGRGKSE